MTEERKEKEARSCCTSLLLFEPLKAFVAKRSVVVSQNGSPAARAPPENNGVESCEDSAETEWCRIRHVCNIWQTIKLAISIVKRRHRLGIPSDGATGKFSRNTV